MILKYLSIEKLSLLIVIFFSSSNISAQVIHEGKTFTTRQVIEGHGLDGIIYRSCTFKNITMGAIKITRISGGLIENCTFENIGNDASCIYFTEDTPNWTVRNCRFQQIGKNAVLTSDGTTNLTIEYNNLVNVAKRTDGNRQHGFYIQGPGFKIQYNRIRDIHYANGISVRSTGTIRGNIINRVGLSGSSAACIKYYPDHPAGPQPLIIENNICWDSSNHVIDIDNKNDQYHADSIVVRFNTVIKRPVTFQYGSFSEGIHIDPLLDDKYVAVYGNLIVNSAFTGDQSAAPPFCDFFVDNLFYEKNPGFFADWENENFHILNDSSVVNAAVNVPFVPEKDVDEQLRPNEDFADIGADEFYMSSSSSSSNPSPSFDASIDQNYPNPFNATTTIQYKLPIRTKVNLNIFNVLGKEIITLVDKYKNPGYHKINWDAADCPSGIYFYRIQAGNFQKMCKVLLIK